MNIVPAIQQLSVPIRILNMHEDRTYDYRKASTSDYLHHEGVCCIPEYSGALVNLGRPFRVRTGHFDDPRVLAELDADLSGVAAAAQFVAMNVGLIGQVYTNMSDMPIDENRLVRVTGKMLVRPEVEEIEEAFVSVTDTELKAMYEELRRMYDVDATVTNEHLEVSAKLAVAYEKVIERHDLSAFGYFWWGKKDAVTQLRAQSALAVSRLASFGRPGVTEGDVKTAMGMKLMDLLSAGGMFTEFFSIDYDGEF